MKKFILRLIGLFITLGIVGVSLIAIVIATSYPKLPSMDELRNYQPKLPLQVYSADGVMLGQFGQEHRIFIKTEQTPKMLINAILAAEDERFYQHSGIDYQGILRAFVSNIMSGRIKSGGSTITMQVARNFFLSSEKTYSRKFNEVMLAYKIEHSLSKNEILELYINQIYLGQRSYGFAEAALTYFGKPIDKLSIAQYAILAGLPKAPSAYNPVANPKRAKERQLYVLGRMRDIGSITEAQYQQALEEKIVVIKGTAKDATDSGAYIAEMTRQSLYDKYGDAIYTQGFRVYTTIDSKLQQAAYTSLRNGLFAFDISRGYRGAEAQTNIGDASLDSSTDQIIMSAFDTQINYGDLLAAVVTDASNNSIKAKLANGNDLEFSGKQLDWVRKFLTSGGDKQIKRGAIIRVRKIADNWTISQLPQVEGSLVSLNPQNGAIKALMGGFDFSKSSFNHVLQAQRQPGSGFKPFIYSAALNAGFTPETIVADAPICFPGGANGDWCPKNDDSKFLGDITFRQALTLSRNTASVRILNQITPKYAIDYVTKFGFDPKAFNPYLTMALGATEVTPMQMARGFAVFANGGYLIDPYFIQKITDDKGKLLAQTKADDIRLQPPTIDPRNAFVMNSILKDVAKYGTGARAYRELHRDDVGGKTGTANDAKDVWFNGYTPDLVTSVWVGYDQPRSLGNHAFGANIPLPIWIDFMRTALANIPVRQLPMPAGITIKPNATWKGDNEYIIDQNYGRNASDVTAEEHNQILKLFEQPISESVVTNNGAESETHGESSAPKASNIDDLIQDIQD